MPNSPLTAAALMPFDISPERGFLPHVDPLEQLPAAFGSWENLAGQLPKLLMTGHLRRMVEAMPVIDSRGLSGGAQLERAMMLLSYIGHAYVWTDGLTGAGAAQRIPSNLAVPWHAVGKRLGRPPVLSYPSYALHNWRRIDPSGPIAIGNIALLQNFWGGADEEWFILIHIDIEASAAGLLRVLPKLAAAAGEKDFEQCAELLSMASAAMEKMYTTLCRMGEWCDPYIYYHRVRPYIHGWKNNPALPNGLVYEGVEEYGGVGQTFRGETGAQSSIVPCVDAILGIKHAPGLLNDYLIEMRTYMPPAHRRFIEHLEAGANLGQLVTAAAEAERPGAFKRAYNELVNWQEKFRAKHYEYAASYIFKQGGSAGHGPQAQANPTDVGTGGTPFMPYLKKHLDETGEHRVK
jgi:indoleamine 2,3-dioxygenase